MSYHTYEAEQADRLEDAASRYRYSPLKNFSGVFPLRMTM